MVLLKDFKSTTAAMIEAQEQEQELRPYLGGSQIGHSCERYLWFSFRWCFVAVFPARMMRLFNRGHREEACFIHELEKVGVKCYGDQTEVVFGHGHAKSHCDGMALGIIEAPKTEHLLEFKTMKESKFKEVMKKGVKNFSATYYGQTQIYMLKLNLTRCMWGAVNKNDDSYYWERIKLDTGFANDLDRKAERVILAEAPPKRLFPPTWFECKYCDARLVCTGKAEVHKTCRTCAHMDLLPAGKWACGLYDDLILATGQQRLACSAYKQIDLGKF